MASSADFEAGMKKAVKAVRNCSVVLLDIEGTITSISFVKDVLFAYVRKEVRAYLEDHLADNEVQDVINDIMTTLGDRKSIGVDVDLELCHDVKNWEGRVNCTVAAVQHWMNCDLKIKPLKQLQGIIWRRAYQSGDIHGHLYPDVVETLTKLKDQAKKVCIYSSGSVEAQKLLVAHSAYGDISQIFSAHFDTAVGLKQNSASYKCIAEKIGCKEDKFVFFTDIQAEAIACAEAGMSAVLVVRPGNKTLSGEAISKFPVINTFQGLAD